MQTVSKTYGAADAEAQAPVCDDNDVLAPSECDYCLNNRGYTGSFRRVSVSDGPDACKK